ncbi:uncharacterized protein ARMOST_20689 [Armillaria ostoyae]|uniref:Uncharacterized protein n=1 Tax=Armillaria ostoyae TaxID=47428 RepID=A0A284S801_ARMOS|nr:uncharacterized protein ARMOST_20689 [Armillaria ostoyae]
MFFFYAANHEGLPRTSHIVFSIATCTTCTPSNRDRVSLEVFSLSSSKNDIALPDGRCRGYSCTRDQEIAALGPAREEGELARVTGSMC